MTAVRMTEDPIENFHFHEIRKKFVGPNTLKSRRLHGNYNWYLTSLQLLRHSRQILKIPKLTFKSFFTKVEVTGSANIPKQMFPLSRAVERTDWEYSFLWLTLEAVGMFYDAFRTGKLLS